MARILGQLSKAATGTTPAPSTSTGSARVLGKIGGLPNTLFTPPPAPAPTPTIGGSIMGAVKGVGNFLTSSEQGLGSGLAGAASQILPKSMTGQSDIDKASQDSLNSMQSLANTIKLRKSQGQDTSRLQSVLQEDMNSAPTTLTDLYPGLKKTNWEVVGDAAGTLADILTAGTYGLAAKGMKAGELGLKVAKPTVIAAGEKGLKAGGDLIKSGAKLIPDLTKKSVLGKDAIKTLGQIGDSEAQKFAKGKTFSEVVNGTQKAIDKFVSKSKTSLQKVKEAIPHIQVDPKKVIDKLNEGIMSSIENSQVYKGMEKDATLFKNPTELINSGLMNADEAKKVQGIVDAVKNWKDTSARGILNLKEKLAPFYKEGLDNSNRVLSRVQNGLKDLVGEVYPKIKPALAKASSNIEKAEEFSRNLIGRDMISGESKLISIAKNLKNPAANAEKIGLLNDLKKFTGHDVVPELKGYANYLELLDKHFPSKIGTIAKAAGTRLGITGGIAAGLGELKNITGL